MGVSGVPDIRESGPTEHPGYLRDIRDIRNQDQGWGYQALSLICLIQHRCAQRVKSESESLAAGSSQLAGPWGASVSRGHLDPRRPARAITLDGT
jgi:hypothetical protein